MIIAGYNDKNNEKMKPSLNDVGEQSSGTGMVIFTIVSVVLV